MTTQSSGNVSDGSRNSADECVSRIVLEFSVGFLVMLALLSSAVSIASGRVG